MSESIRKLLADTKNNPFFYGLKDDEFYLPSLDSFFPTELKYLTTDIFSAYLNIIIQGSNNVNKKTISSNTRDDFLEINFESLEFRISNELYLAIHNNSTQISILPIGLFFPYPTKDGHSNIIIINPTIQTIEFFEPHGIEYSNSIENIIDTTSIIFKVFFKIFPEFNKFNVINSSKNCLIGLQGIQGYIDKSVGHCLAWSLLFIQLRLSHLNKSSDFIVSSISKLNPISLDHYIKQYITFLNSIYINKKTTSSFQKVSFRNLLSKQEIDIENEYLKSLISEYWAELQKKIDIIDNDTSPNICIQCELIGITNNHKYSYCSFNQGMLELNNKISKLFKSIYGYKNTPFFDENFQHESVAFFFKDVRTPNSSIYTKTPNSEMYD